MADNELELWEIAGFLVLWVGSIYSFAALTSRMLDWTLGDEPVTSLIPWM